MKTTVTIPIKRGDCEIDLAVTRDGEEGPLSFFLPAVARKSSASFEVDPADLARVSAAFAPPVVGLPAPSLPVDSAGRTPLPGQTDLVDALGGDANACGCRTIVSDVGGTYIDDRSCSIHGRGA